MVSLYLSSAAVRGSNALNSYPDASRLLAIRCRVRGLLASFLLSETDLGFDSLADLPTVSVHPRMPTRLAERPQDLVVNSLDPVSVAGLRLGGNNVHLRRDLSAVRLQW